MLRLAELKRMAKYGLVGVMNTGVDFAVFCALVYGAGLASIGAQVISYGAGLANSYFWNRWWTFRSANRRQAGEVAKFIFVNACSFGAATAVLLAMEQMGAGAAVAKAFSVVVALVVNYFGYRLWVFRMETREEGAG